MRLKGKVGDASVTHCLVYVRQTVGRVNSWAVGIGVVLVYSRVLRP